MKLATWLRYNNLWHALLLRLYIRKIRRAQALLDLFDEFVGCDCECGC